MATAAQQREEAVAAAPGLQSREAIDQAIRVEHLQDALEGEVPFRSSWNVGKADMLKLVQRAVDPPGVLSAQPAFHGLLEAELLKHTPGVVYGDLGRQELVQDAPFELEAEQGVRRRERVKVAHLRCAGVVLEGQGLQGRRREGLSALSV